MSKRKPANRRQRRPAETDPRLQAGSPFASGGLSAHRIFLAALTVLLAGAPLIPVDSPPADGLSVVLSSACVVLLFAWMLTQYFRRELVIRAGWVELALALFFALAALSALQMADQGNARSVINAAWRWISFGVIFFLARQLLQTEFEQRAVCVVMIGVSVGLAGYGLFQYFVELPAAREAYDRDPVGVMRQAGIQAELDSPQARQFFNRLRASTEPFATFVLANSLAGFLTPWLILTGGIAVGQAKNCLGNLSRKNQKSDPGQVTNLPYTLLGAALCLSVLSLCLVLTKSRTAWVSAAMGFVLVAAVQPFAAGFKKKAALLVGLAILVTVLAAVAARMGGVDKEVLSQTAQSFSYRLEYWRACVEMIGEYPWFGCGPGNFQDFYTAFKLPQASETVADPHNFLLEIWATTGSMALLAFLAALSLMGWTVAAGVKKRRANVVSSPPPPVNEPPASNFMGQTVFWVLAGGAIGVGASMPYHMLYGLSTAPVRVMFVLLCIAAAAGWLWRWMLAPSVSRRLHLGMILAALAAWTINLLAAGGISFPNVALSGWLLLAMAMNQCGGGRTISISRPLGAVGSLAAVGLVVVCMRTLYTPVLNARRFIAQAYRTPIHRERAEFLQDAAAADPHCPVPLQLLAPLWLEEWFEKPSRRESTQARQIFSRFEAAAEELLNRQPRSSGAHRRVGNYYLDAYQRSREAAHLEKSIQAYEKAVELFPSSSITNAQLAWTYHLAGRTADARRQAEFALDLDQQLARHPELRLKQQRVYTGRAAQPKVVPSNNQASNPISSPQNAEQLMNRLRNNKPDG